MSYKNFPLAKRGYKACPDAGYKWTKVQSDRFNFRVFSSKKPTFELASMHSASSEGSNLRLSYDLEL